MISTSLGIKSNAVPPMSLFEKHTLNKDLSTDEHQQLLGFSLILTTLQDHGSAEDKVGIDYISKFYSHFCNNYSGYSELPEQAKLSFDVANYSGAGSFMKEAYNASDCPETFLDL